MLDPLSRLAVQHGTDKFGAHQYTPHYHKLFASRREDPLRLLEIGIGGYDMPFSGGKSLMMWADYFSNGKIVGLDIAPKRMAVPPRVSVVQGSQTDTAFLDQVCAEHGPFDIIIDDGSHVVEHVQTSFHHLYPRMPADGIYVVEDTQTAFWPRMGGNVDAKGTIFDTAHDVAVAMHAREVQGAEPTARPYGDITQSVQVFRNMVVFERGSNLFPSNAAFRMEDPGVEQMMQILSAEVIRNPAPGSFLTRMDMTNCAARFDLSLDALNQGLQLYPFNVDILLAGVRMLDHVKHSEDAITLIKRLIMIYPDDPDILKMMEGRG